jgi:hypothetical protein
MTAAMAAVLCLIFLPLIAALGFMLGVTQGDLSVGSVLGAATFLLLGAGLFVGAFNMSRGWEQDADR